VIEEVKRPSAIAWSGCARAAALEEPEFLADELFLLLEGARVSARASAATAPRPASCAWGRRSSPRTPPLNLTPPDLTPASPERHLPSRFGVAIVTVHAQGRW